MARLVLLQETKTPELALSREDTAKWQPFESQEKKSLPETINLVTVPGHRTEGCYSNSSQLKLCHDTSFLAPAS